MSVVLSWGPFLGLLGGFINVIVQQITDGSTQCHTEEVMTVVTVSPKFQVVIPQAIREALSLEPGQKVQAIQYDDRIEFIPVKSPRSMRGFLRGIDTRVKRDPDRV